MADKQTDEGAENALLQEMLSEAQDDYAKAVFGETARTTPLIKPGSVARGEPQSRREALVAELDARISAQLEELVHHPAVQRLEAAWRALRCLVDGVDFDENVRIQLLNCSKEDLAEDFEEASDVTVSGLYRRLCEPELLGPDDAPVSVIVADYELDHHQQDIELLRHCAAVAADAHAPFIANASPGFFCCERFAQLAALGDVERIFESPRYASWDSFRSSEDARYVGLCVPSILLRPETENTPVPLFGPASHAFAIQVAETFAQHRWFDRLTELARVGAGEGLPEGRQSHTEGPTNEGQVEVALSERLACDLSTHRFIVLRGRAEAVAAASSANSTQRPKRFPDTPEGRSMELNYRAGAELPNVLNICRVAHFLEAIGRELGVSEGAALLERALQQWLLEQVADTVAGDTKGCGKPFLEAHIRVSARDYYRYELEARASRDKSDFTVWVAGTLGEVE